LSDPWEYSVLAESIEAWGFRAIQDRGEWLERDEMARLWLETEYRPVVETLREAHLIGDGTDAEAYLRVAEERYRLMRTHIWNDEVIQRVLEGEGRRRRRPWGVR
jgi:hypothetical protein